MATFFAQTIITLFVLIKIGTIIDDLANSFRSLMNYQINDCRITQSISGNQSIFYMLIETVGIFIPNTRNSSLRILGIGFIGLRFGNNRNGFIGKSLGRFNRKSESGNSRTNHQKIRCGGIVHGINPSEAYLIPPLNTNRFNPGSVFF